MGMRRFIVTLLAQIGKTINPMETDEQKRKAMDIINPRHAPGGFLGISAVIMCECESPIIIDASPSHKTEEEIREEVAEGARLGRDVSILKIEVEVGSKDTDTGTQVTEKHEHVATNLGFSSHECEECGRKYITAWQFEAIQVNKSVTFPWDDPEGLDHPSSGSSCDSRPISETVH